MASLEKIFYEISRRQQALETSIRYDLANTNIQFLPPVGVPLDDNQIVQLLGMLLASC